MNNINDFPVQVRFPVAWGEMDIFCHVNNVSYYRYFENARIKYFDEIGIFEIKTKTGIAPVLAETKCKYLQSLTYPDNLTVGAKVRSIGQTSFIMDYLIFSEKLGVAATGEGVLVMYDFNTSQKTKVPAEIKNAIKKLEKR
ncbi:MAG: thioesterase family protein [Clostridia bacterium]|nr:thioesterase family protein [Clostridia bacterium]